MSKFNLLFFALLLLAGCTSSRTESLVMQGVAGDPVQSICFTRSINSWQPYSRDSLILRRGLNDYFRLQVSGSCELDRAFNSIAVISRGGSCLNVGDRIDVPDDFGGSCTIRKIETWIVPEE